jgi:hypothetical protein
MSEQHSDPNKISKYTTPTWEMELLISGATVFGLMQLPQPLARTFAILMHSNEAAIAELLSVFSVYIQSSLIILILTFVLHLIARGYWVALVGINSVYPGGIQWNSMKSTGPVYREIHRMSVGTTEEALERADNRATLVFSLGFGIAVSILIPVVFVGVLLGILMFLQAINLDMQNMKTISWTIILVMIAPFILVTMMDYVIGEKLMSAKKESWLRKTLELYNALGMKFANNIVLSTFVSNSAAKSKFAMLAVIGAVVGALSGLVLLNTQGRSPDNGAYDGLPKETLGSDYTLRPQHYASLRNENISLNLSAYIDDPVVNTSYMKVFVPYEPSAHTALMKKICPDALTKLEKNKGLGLNCLYKFHAIKIDGKLVEGAFLASADAKTGLRGMVAMIDVRALEKGQHMLYINDLPNPDKESKEPENKIQKIPFWK